MPTLAPSSPRVNPTPADLLLGDRLAHLADGGDPDAYRPDWRTTSLDPFTGKSYELHPLDAGFFPEADPLDLDALNWFAQLDEEAEAEHLADLRDEAEAYAGYMALAGA